MSSPRIISALVAASTLLPLAACSDDAEETGSTTVAIENDFDNDEFDRKPPWTICEAHYGGADFGKVEIGQRSESKPVTPGIGYVYMVAAWNDPTCAKEHALPIASRNEEEVVEGQSRTIFINLPNHQGPCPPEGVQPIPQELYDRILELWPEYGFLPYDQRTDNTQWTQ
ncbi:MAG: hypothetical protein ACOC1F_01710 [Myxococcota bacterium]